MACTQTLTGILQDCETSMGGIVMAYIANYGDIDSIERADEGKIMAIAMKADTKFKSYYTRRGASSMVSNLNVDPANGVNYVTTDVVLTFPKMNQANRDEMAKLAVGKLSVIVKDANGKYWLVGAEHPVMASAGTGQTGTAVGDANNYQITLQDNASTFPYEVDATAIESIID